VLGAALAISGCVGLYVWTKAPGKVTEETVLLTGSEEAFGVVYLTVRVEQRGGSTGFACAGNTSFWALHRNGWRALELACAPQADDRWSCQGPVLGIDQLIAGLIAEWESQLDRP
jgi:hypothetical protein